MKTIALYVLKLNNLFQQMLTNGTTRNQGSDMSKQFDFKNLKSKIVNLQSNIKNPYSSNFLLTRLLAINEAINPRTTIVAITINTFSMEKITG